MYVILFCIIYLFTRLVQRKKNEPFLNIRIEIKEIIILNSHLDN